MEQLGEKQDFESELSRLGFSHDHFVLYVRRATPHESNWSPGYAVCVTNTVTKRRNIYWGGPGKPWLAEFVSDVMDGLYGQHHSGTAPTSQFSPTRNVAGWKGR